MIALTRAVESLSVNETQRIVSAIRLERLRKELGEARKTATRTSGARGKKARERLIQLEAELDTSLERFARFVNTACHGLTPADPCKPWTFPSQPP